MNGQRTIANTTAAATVYPITFNQSFVYRSACRQFPPNTSKLVIGTTENRIPKQTTTLIG